MAYTFDVGDVVRCTAEFTNLAGDGADPTVVTFKVTDPAGTMTPFEFSVDLEVVKVETGLYYIDVPIDQSEAWLIRCEGTGFNAAACESYFNVRTSRSA